MEVCFAVQRGTSPERTSVESLVRSEADFRFQCTTSSVESLVRSEADSHFWFLMAVLGTTAVPWLGRGLPSHKVQKARKLQLLLLEDDLSAAAAPL